MQVLHTTPLSSVPRWARRSIQIALMTGAMATVLGCAHVTPSGPSSESPSQSNAIAETVGIDDAHFQRPYVDIDEWRDAPVRHRYVHGGFHGTDTRFSLYFPPEGQYQGRFFQHITPVPDNEHLAQRPAVGEESKLGFALASGAYFIETNGGGTEGEMTPYRANAAVAQYSRMIAADVYGRTHRPWGYAYGGSGGGYRTIGSIENTTGVWDGVVPYVIGTPVALPNVFTVRMHAMRVLGDKLDQVVDALEPGGSGDPYAGLDEEEAAALREVTRMGFPMPSWFGHRTMGIHGFAALYQGMVGANPGYFEDFWKVPGYLGATPPASLLAARLQHSTGVAAAITLADGVALGLVQAEADGGVDNAFKAQADQRDERIVTFRLQDIPAVQGFLGGDLVIEDGPLAGKRLFVTGIQDDIALLGDNPAELVAGLTAGTRVRLDNSNFLAAQTYHRHQVPAPEYTVWDQFRGADGQPLYPQRPRLLGPSFTRAASGALPSGKFQGKMIVVASLWDREAFPWQADWYRGAVRTHLGEQADANFRLWFTDRALHGDETRQEDATRTVSYLGVLQQALRDLSRWVEQGIAPPAATQYRVEDGQVVLPASATEREGIQPTVHLQVDGGERADVAPGTPVTLSARIEVPRGAGSVVSAEWDLEGSGNYPIQASLPQARDGSLTLQAQFKYDQPGTYFPTLRVAAQRDGDADTPYARIQNLGRVRIVVK